MRHLEPIIGQTAGLLTRAGASNPLSEARLTKAAHEFEAQMMKELLRPMTGHDALTGTGSDDGGDTDSNSPLSEFASEALGQALSLRGGFGIADRIVHELSHSGKSRTTGKVTRKLDGSTALKSLQ